jgi:hypothetical protein
MEITLGKIVSYLSGLSLIGLGLVFLLLSMWAVIPLLAGILILPPVRRLLDTRADITFSRGATVGIGSLGAIALVGVVLLVAFGGGGSVADAPATPADDGSEATAAPGDLVSQVDITARNESTSPTKSLGIRWNSRAQRSVDADPDDAIEGDERTGYKYLVVRAEVTNTGNESIELTPQMFALTADNVTYESGNYFGPNYSFSDIELQPGGSRTGWVAFEIPVGVSDGALTVDHYSGNVSTSFTHDESFPINMPV